MSTNNNAILVQNLPGIISPTFSNKVCDDSLSSCVINNKSSNAVSCVDIAENLSQGLNHNPDGWLLFIAKEYQEQVKEIIQKDFLYAYKKNTLNLNNGWHSETVLYHNIDSGVITEFVDSHHGSLFFSDLMEKIQYFIDVNHIKPKDLLFFDVNHMSTSLDTLKDEDYGYEFLNILKANNFTYQSPSLSSKINKKIP